MQNHVFVRCNMKRTAYLETTRASTAAWTASTLSGGRGLSDPRAGDGAKERRPPPTDKKKTVRTITKLAHLGQSSGRSPLTGMLGHVRRALATAAPDRRPSRPLQDVDGWSDQAEVAYYEDCRASRCP